MADLYRNREQVQGYASYRPNYPPELFNFIYSKTNGRRQLAWDVATGSGQAAVSFSSLFDVVVDRHRLQPRADLPRPHSPAQRSLRRHPSLLNHPRSPPPGCPAGIRQPNNRRHGPALARHPGLLFPGPRGPAPPRRRRGRLGLRL
ncbi:hypothetical protein KSP39_PZI015197 [Platanthera zijinensis]|uniref:Methyltransferase n=1 Tax=Platanthera zijinensis TaxID=2320716 RepID=A0AAP0B8Q4_9ASPA